MTTNIKQQPVLKPGIVGAPEKPPTRFHPLDNTWRTDSLTHFPVEERLTANSEPKFVSILPQNITIWQFQGFHLETRVDPFADQTMSVHWEKDGQPLIIGSRVNLLFDRGFTMLDFAFCYPTDSGTYKCIATNRFGTTHSSDVVVFVIPDDAGLADALWSRDSIQVELSQELAEKFNQVLEPSEPLFKREVEPASLSVKEGEYAELVVPLSLGNGQKIDHEWYKDGELIMLGSRITGQLEIGRSRLIIHYCYEKDSGHYHCVISTEHGEAKSSTAQLICTDDHVTIDMTSQLPGNQKKQIEALEALEASLQKDPEHKEIIQRHDTEAFSAPIIKTELENIPNVGEYQSFHMEVLYEPVDDNSLFIDWYKDGQLLTSGSRFLLVQERGVASLEVFYTVPQDSGHYWCVAKSKSGQTESKRITVECCKVDTVASENVTNPEEMRMKEIQLDSQKLRRFSKVSEMGETVKLSYDYPPEFDIEPVPAKAMVGNPARFLVRCRGNPRPTLEWWLNDCQMSTDNTIYRIYDDGAINYLEIRKCEDSGTHVIRVVARNELGQTEAKTTLTVIPMDDFRPNLRAVGRKMAGANIAYKAFESLSNDDKPTPPESANHQPSPQSVEPPEEIKPPEAPETASDPPVANDEAEEVSMGETPPETIPTESEVEDPKVAETPVVEEETAPPVYDDGCV